MKTFCLCALLLSRAISGASIHPKCIELNSVANPVDYLAIGYFITSLLSVPSSDTSNVILKIRKIGDEHRLRLLLLELSKYPIGEANVRRLEITMQLHDINSYSHQIFEGLQHNFALVYFNLSNTGLVATEDTAQALTTMLQVNKTLTHLDLSGNPKFSDSGAYCVFQCLQHNTSLVNLNISNTGLVATKDTAQAITKMLQVNKTLTHLDLSKNHDLSGACVYQGLQDNISLVYLNLSNTRNLVTEYTAQALSKMLKYNKTLTHLLLSNKLRLFSYYCVFEDLQHNTTLVHLNISKTGACSVHSLQMSSSINTYRPRSHWSYSDAGAYCVSQGLQTQYLTSLLESVRHQEWTDSHRSRLDTLLRL